MSEHFPQNLDEEFFELDRALTDPLMQRTLSQARYWSQQLRDGAVPKEKYNDIITELDEEWTPFRKEKVLVTGNIVYVVDEEPVVLNVREQEVISNGFSILPAIIDNDGQILAGKGYPELRHHLYVPTSIIPDANSDEPFMAVFSDLDIHMEPQTSSFERAESWMKTSFPDFKDEVDQIRAVSGRDEILFLMSLRELTLPDKFDGNDVIGRECLKTYINQLIDFDHNMAYVVTIQQFVDAEIPNQSLLERLRLNVRLFEIHGFNVMEAVGADELKQWTLGIDGELHGPRKNLQPQLTHIPLPNLMDILSIRREYTQDDSLDS